MTAATETQTATRWFVIRDRQGKTRIGACDDKAHARDYANHLYRNCGVVAPVVVAAPDQAAALDKFRRCMRREITCRQAADPKVA